MSQATPAPHVNPLLPHGALSGLKVIDASRVLGGPICGQMLGDHGAEVIKVEAPAGDDTRRWGPPDLGPVSAYFSGANRNKRVQVLDLNRAEDFARFEALIQGADVLLENFMPASAAKWGLTPAFTQALNPRLVHCRVSGFGDVGPLAGLPAYDTAVQALCGLMSVNGDAHSGPLRVGLPVVDMSTGLNAMIGVLLALQARQLTGRGQFVETTLFANAVAMLHPHASNCFATGKNPVRTGNAHPNIYPYDSFATQTGPIYLAIGNDKQFQGFCAHLGQPQWASEPRFASNPQRVQHLDDIDGRIARWFAAHDYASLSQLLEQHSVPFSKIYSIADVVDDPHFQARGAIVRLPDAELGSVPAPVAVPRFGPQAPAPRTGPATGEHNDEIYGALGLTPAQLAALKAAHII